MSSLSVSASQFKVIEASLDIKLIIPVLEDLGLLSLSDKENLAEKSQKQAVKFILRHVRQHSEGLKLFHDVLEKTKANVGHQKVLQVLYPTEDLELQADGMITNMLYLYHSRSKVSLSSHKSRVHAEESVNDEDTIVLKYFFVKNLHG